MGLKGTILTIREATNTTWLVGGVANKSLIAEIRFDNGEVISKSTSDLMKIDD
tara:strand:+ start:2625 stop:2783 length:159 start_codon:yes stop_codon:yes gene_type:complete